MQPEDAQFPHAIIALAPWAASSNTCLAECPAIVQYPGFPSGIEPSTIMMYLPQFSFIERVRTSSAWKPLAAMSLGYTGLVKAQHSSHDTAEFKELPTGVSFGFQLLIESLFFFHCFLPIYGFSKCAVIVLRSAYRESVFVLRIVLELLLGVCLRLHVLLSVRFSHVCHFE